QAQDDRGRRGNEQAAPASDQPAAVGRATTAPAAIASKTRPSWPSPDVSRALTAGMWGSQLARTAPLTKNRIETASRDRRMAPCRSDPRRAWIGSRPAPVR